MSLRDAAQVEPDRIEQTARALAEADGMESNLPGVGNCGLAPLTIAAYLRRDETTEAG